MSIALYVCMYRSRGLMYVPTVKVMKSRPLGPVLGRLGHDEKAWRVSVIILYETKTVDILEPSL